MWRRKLARTLTLQPGDFKFSKRFRPFVFSIYLNHDKFRQKRLQFITYICIPMCVKVRGYRLFAPILLLVSERIIMHHLTTWLEQAQNLTIFQVIPQVLIFPMLKCQSAGQKPLCC